MGTYVYGKPAGQSEAGHISKEQRVVITGIRLDTGDVLRLGAQIFGVIMALSLAAGILFALVRGML